MTLANDPLRVALLGYGLSGKTFHAPLVAAVPGLALHVIASSRPDAVREDWPEARVEPDAHAAIARADVDLVVVATPNGTHFELARAALEAGKHVVVDKPFTLTLDEARALSATASSRGLVLSVFHNRRWDGDFLTLSDLASRGVLGTIVEVASHFDRFAPDVRDRWRERDLPGSGLWYDLGPHLVDQALRLLGRPDAVRGDLAAQRQGAVTTDWAQVVLQYGARRVVLHASMMAPGGSARFVVHGTRASYVKHGLDTQEATLRAGGTPGAPGWGEDARAGVLFRREGARETREEVPTLAGDYRRYYEAIRDAIAHGAPSPVTPDEAVEVMEVLALATRSAREGRVIALAPA